MEFAIAIHLAVESRRVSMSLRRQFFKRAIQGALEGGCCLQKESASWYSCYHRARCFVSIFRGFVSFTSGVEAPMNEAPDYSPWNSFDGKHDSDTSMITVLIWNGVLQPRTSVRVNVEQ
jgi:hypothetical protein